MQDFRTKANQIAFINTETLKAGNVQKAIESVESKIPYDEYGGNKLFLKPSMSASEINSKIENMENRGIVIFEEGTYNLNKTINVVNKKDLTFIGDGEVLLVGSGGNLLSLEACENIKIVKVEISEGNIKTKNTDGFSLERCSINGSFSIQSKNTKVIDCVFTDGISAHSGTDSLKIENTEILDGGLKIYLSYRLGSEEAKVYILNTKVKGESYFSGIKAKFENVIFQDRFQSYGADIQITSCDFLHEGDESENGFYANVSKLKMEKCFINAKKSFIDKAWDIPGGISINNCILMGELRTYCEGSTITNSEILGGLVHGGENSRIEKNIIKSEKESEASVYLLDDNITVINNEIENTVGIGFRSVMRNCQILNNKISGFLTGVKLTGNFLFQNNIVTSAQGQAGEVRGQDHIISNNTFESVEGCSIRGSNIIFSKNIVKSDNNGVIVDGGLNFAFTGNIIEAGNVGFKFSKRQGVSLGNITFSNNQITESNTGIFIEGENHIISNNIVYSDNVGIYSNKATKCSITTNIATSIIDDSGSETDPEKGNYYLGNITDSFELLADEGFTNIAIVEDSLQAFADSLDYLQNKFN